MQQQQQQGHCDALQQSRGASLSQQHGRAGCQHQIGNSGAFTQAISLLHPHKQQQQHVHWQDQLNDEHQPSLLQCPGSVYKQSAVVEDPFKDSLLFPMLIDFANAGCPSTADGSSGPAVCDISQQTMTDVCRQPSNTDTSQNEMSAAHGIHIGASRHCRQAGSTARPSKAAVERLRQQQAAQRLHVRHKFQREDHAERGNTSSLTCLTASSFDRPTPASLLCPCEETACATPVKNAVLSSLSEQEFWDAARADLVDTVEAAKRKPCARPVLSPVTMPALSAGYGDKAADMRAVGITPLLGTSLCQAVL